MSPPTRKTAMISSTAADLPDHRKQAIEACQRQSVFPIAMEHLPAQDATGIKASLDMVDRADIYIGIYAHRYGWIPTDETVAKAEKELNIKLDRGISITEMEFNRALQRGIPILVFTISENHTLTIQMVETGDLPQAKLAVFKKRAEENRIRAKFDSPADLRAHIIQALAALEVQTTPSGAQAIPQFHPINIIPRPPEPYIAHPYSLLQTKNVIGRETELNLLTDWITKNQTVPADTRIFNLVAIGGMGKSALTWKWFTDIAPKELPNLAGRMWWSFYESDAYFENFIIRALAYSSAQPEDQIRKLNPLDRDNQLLHLLDTKPFLLVLDGLERILIAYARLDAAQMLDDDLDEKTANPLGVPALAGQDKNPQVKVSGLAPESAADSFYGKHHLRRTADHRAGQFLRRLTRIKQSRILITTRLYPTELQADTGDPLPACHAELLRGLTDADALNLWRAFNVTGSTDQLLPLFRSFGNYPLLIRAFAGEIANYRPAPRDFDQWRAANPDFNPTLLPLINAKTHVLEYALQSLTEPQREVLHTISAFRMPATWNTLRALLVPDPGGTRSTASQISPGDPQPPESSAGDTKDTPRPEKIASPKPCPNLSILDLVLTELEDRGLLGWDKKLNRYDLHPIVRSIVWEGLNAKMREKIHLEMRDYFSVIPLPKTFYSLEDLTPGIELYSSLLELEMYDEAFELFHEHISGPTHYLLGRYRERSALLEGLFPEGIATGPRLNQVGARASAFCDLGLAYLMQGSPGLALDTLTRAVDEAVDPRNIAVTLGNTAIALRFSGFLCKAETAIRKALSIAYSKALTEGDFQGDREFMRSVLFQLLGIQFGIRGARSESKIAQWRTILFARRSENAQLEGISNGFLAEAGLREGQFEEAFTLATRALNQAASSRHERDAVFARRLQGEAALGLQNRTDAHSGLEEALSRARVISLIQEELPILTALAELHRRKAEFSTAHELLDQIWDTAERGPYPLFHADALNVLAQIERDQGNTKAAIAAATKAYTLAWCDGISADGKQCYAYHYGLTNARKHLEELGAPVPQLPPFDESKFDPLPEVELNPKDEFWVDPATLD